MTPGTVQSSFRRRSGARTGSIGLVSGVAFRGRHDGRRRGVRALRTRGAAARAGGHRGVRTRRDPRSVVGAFLRRGRQPGPARRFGLRLRRAGPRTPMGLPHVVGVRARRGDRLRYRRRTGRAVAAPGCPSGWATADAAAPAAGAGQSGVRVLHTLDTVEELCVGDLVLALNGTEDAAGYALRVLRTAGYVAGRRATSFTTGITDDFPVPLREHQSRRMLSSSRAVSHRLPRAAGRGGSASRTPRCRRNAPAGPRRRAG